MGLSVPQIKDLISILGRDGAIAGLENSKIIKVEMLKELANSLSLTIGSKDSKKKIVAEIIRHIDKRITKSIDELKSMNTEQLIQYFETVECDQEELVSLLSTIDLKARAKSLRSLIEFAAIQIQSLGIFERIADRNSKKTPSQ
ncbi:MAG: hypothetical protein ACLP3B_12675 [Syntrophobacteraceae bacterium]